MADQLETILKAVEAHATSLSPMKAQEFLATLQMQIANYSFSLTTEVISPMVKAGRTDLLLAPPGPGLIMPDTKILKP